MNLILFHLYLFKWNKDGLNSWFSFSSLTGCLSKLKNLVCPTIYPLIEEKRWIYTEVKCKQPHPGFKLGLLIPFYMIITITFMCFKVAYLAIKNVKIRIMRWFYFLLYFDIVVFTVYYLYFTTDIVSLVL